MSGSFPPAPEGTSKGITGMKVSMLVDIEISDENLNDMIETAGYGGVNYWCNRIHEDAPGIWTIYEMVEDEKPNQHQINSRSLIKAFLLLANPNQQLIADYVHQYFLQAVKDGDKTGLDVGHIDATAADCLVQIACFGELVYG